MRVDRRSFLAMGSAALLASCGSDSTSGGSVAAPSTSGSPVANAADGFVIVRRFTNTSLTPGRVRLPVSLADRDQTLFQHGPAEITGRVLDDGAKPVTSFTAALHGTDLVIPYWPITVQLPKAGLYSLEVDGATDGPAAFQVFDPADVPIPTVGSKLPPFDTPTNADPRGVDPVCTLVPPCPFHDTTLTDALRADLPVVYIVGTPAHCQTGTCGPGLQFLVADAARYTGRATFVHAEVYTDNTATSTAPAVAALKLDYEPLIFITDKTGVIVDRLDVIWDAAELADVLAGVLGPVS
jgi:hypothetical protein